VLCLDYGYKLAASPSDLTRPQINFLVAALNHRLEVVAASGQTEPGVTKIIFTDDMEEE
jgi:hypothetical protein